MKTNRSLNFFCHLLILFIHQFQSSKKSTKSIISIKKSEKSVIAFHFIIIFHYFSIKSENDRFFFVLKNRLLKSIRIVIIVLIELKKKDRRNHKCKFAEINQL